MDNQCHSFVQSLSHHSHSLIEKSLNPDKDPQKISFVARRIKTTIKETVRTDSQVWAKQEKENFFFIINSNLSNIIFYSIAYSNILLFISSVVNTQYE